MEKPRPSIVKISTVAISFFAVAQGLLLFQSNLRFALATLILSFFVVVFFQALDFHARASGLYNPEKAEEKQDERNAADAPAKNTPIAEDPKRRLQRQASAWGMVTALVIPIFLFVFQPSHDFLVGAYYSTPTPALSPTPSLTATLLNTSTPQPTPTPSPTPAVAILAPSATSQLSPTASPAPCLCQQPGDDEMIQCLIKKEGEAMQMGGQEGLGLLAKIFLPNAVIYRGDKNITWYDPLSYYQTTLSTLNFSSASHPQIVQKRLLANQAFYISSSAGVYSSKDGQLGKYDNPLPSDHWVLAKNSKGCWNVTYYAFNSAHIIPFPPEGP